MTLNLYYNGGEHILVKEYYTYAMYSFIADFGGYLVSITYYLDFLLHIS